jgi:DNA-binding MarR family transcriptional regulator
MSPTKTITEVIQEWSEVFMHRSGREFRHFMDSSGLSFSQVNVLMRLFHGAICGVSGIGEEMGVSNPAASQAVERLVQMGMIERTEDPDDRRSKRLVLTEKGRAMVESGIKDRSQWIKDLAVTLTKDQQQTVISALTILTDMARKNESDTS